MQDQPDEKVADARRGRDRTRRAAFQARAKRIAARAEEERRRRPAVAVAFELFERDNEVGGGIIAGALAYRFFIWLLPYALVCVAGLGIAASAVHESPEAAAKATGLAGLVSSSVAHAADSPARWYALIVGVVALLLATRSVLRAIIGAHRLVWVDVLERAPKPTPAATLKFFGLFISFFIITGLSAALRSRYEGPGILALILLTLLYIGLWLVISLQMPHKDAPWKALIPGAILVGVGIEVLHVLAALVIAPYAVSKQGTYGALGAAAALLVGLFLVGRLVVLSAALNATLWERSRA